VKPRLVDWLLLAFVLAETATGLLSFLEGRPEGRWLLALHGALGLGILLLLAWKLRRVYPRLVERRLWDRATLISVAALLFVLLTVASGVIWSTWQWPLGYPNGLNLHVIWGLALTLAVALHMALRFKPLRRADLQGRRAALRFVAVLAAGGAFWLAQNAAAQGARLPGGRRRFTGSYEVGSLRGLAFPVTMWMFDAPAPVDVAAWRLRVGGAVTRPLALTAGNVASLPQASVKAVLDCTGGWYTEQLWRGVRVGDLLDAAQPQADAVAVSFVSVTGYRWSLSLGEARAALLATHAGDDALDHGRGAPLRLVAPGRRGFQWVKWVERVEVLTARDAGQWAVIFTSGLDGT
jgi:DMSO/TMAO reductase YedYZ molybdopterin-dependent catalytic subunit